MGEIVNFVRHKTAGWAGVVYLDKRGQKRVNNGCVDWPLTQEREEKLSVVEKKRRRGKGFSRPVGRQLRQFIHQYELRARLDSRRCCQARRGFL